MDLAGTTAVPHAVPTRRERNEVTMPRKAMNTLGDLERAVMEQVWLAAEEGRAPVSVREVHEALGRAAGSPTRP